MNQPQQNASEHVPEIGIEDLLDEIAEQFLEQLKRHEEPAVNEWVRRYPDHADEISKLAKTLQTVELLKSRDQSVDANHKGIVITDGTELTHLGEYRLIREIGRGGMGLVFEAHQESLGRRVALKLLPQRTTVDRWLLERFQREAKSAALLQHSNIVPIYGVGEDSGLHFFTMQFVDGSNLDQLIEEIRGLREGQPTSARDTSPLTESLLTSEFRHKASDESVVQEDADTVVDRGKDTVRVDRPSSSSVSISEGRRFYRNIARIGVQVAEALDYAHGQGILHRDIKPSNLMVDVDGNAWITDFGLAKIESDVSITDSGALCGTLRYMAPERFSDWADRRSDVYSLGATLYELATLRPAFPEEDRVQLIRSISHNTPPPPRSIVKEIPADLETIILKSVEREPGRRYRSARELAEDLERFLDGRPIRARRTPQLERVLLWARRNPAIAALAAVSCVLLLLASAASSIGWWSTASALQKAEEHHDRFMSSIDDYLYEVTNDEILRSPGLESLRIRLLNRALRHFESMVDGTEADSRLARSSLAEANRRIAQIRMELGDLAGAREALDISLLQVNELLAEQDDSRILMIKGNVMGDLGRLNLESRSPKEALQNNREAEGIHNSLIAREYKVDENQCELGMLQLRNGSVHLRMSNIAAAEEAFGEAETTFLNLLKDDEQRVEWRSSLAKARGNRAYLLQLTGRLEESDAIIRSIADEFLALAKIDATPTRHLENYGKAMGHLSVAARRRNELENSRDYLAKAQEAFDKLAQDNPQVTRFRALQASTRNDLGTAYLYEDRLEEAEVVLQEAIRLMERVLEASPETRNYRLEFADCQFLLACIPFQRFQWEAAREGFQKALDELNKPLYNFEDFQTRTLILHTRLKLGYALEKLERSTEARPHLEFAHREILELAEIVPKDIVEAKDLLLQTEVGRELASD